MPALVLEMVLVSGIIKNKTLIQSCVTSSHPGTDFIDLIPQHEPKVTLATEWRVATIPTAMYANSYGLLFFLRPSCCECDL